ncbi:MAG: peptidyl-prolyl cis-trans isomerase [Candidatus Handelsmanbacteria bacterium]|nr:peptidyl-prolyl cis-trans isomerase [Candidatus Handelsmanbacteria bacterium]
MTGVCLLLSLLLLAGCAAGPEKPADPQLLARVGDRELTAQKLDKALKTLYPTGAPAGAEGQVLQRLIDTELMVMAAVAQNLDRDPRVDGLVRQKEQELLLAELYRRGILKISGGVSPEEAREYFARHRLDEERRVSRILVGSGQVVEQIMKRLQGGESFAALAGEFSDDPKTASLGGDLGWMSRASFKNHLLRRQIFGARIGQVLGPIKEPDGYSLLLVAEERRTSFDQVAATVERVVAEEKQSFSTLKYLEGLTDDAQVREDPEALQLLLTRLSEAGTELPQLRKGESGRMLLGAGQVQWTLQQFMDAMLSERDQAEISTLEDLRLYARRLFALKELLPKRAEELGFRQTEEVQKGVEQTRREALMDRLRQVEVEERLNPGEEEVRRYYEQHREVYVRPERISIIEILTETREEAEAALQETRQGRDMAEIANRYSVRSARVRRAGGRILLTRPDKYGEVGLEAQHAQVGQIVGPVKSSQGYSVFKVVSKTPAQPHSFEDSRIRAAYHLKQELAEERFEELIRRLNQKYAGQIQRYEDHLQAYAATRQ